MAEHWKSTPRFWCKQCKIYIRDTAFEKSQHEASGKHQGNLKRFLRDIHRDNERQQRESQKAKNEVERLRQTVSGNASGNRSATAGTAAAAATTPAAPPERPVSIEERKRQMAQLAEMGVAIPDEYRGGMAMAGDWQTTSVKVIPSRDEENDKAGASSTGVRKKRKHEGDGEEEEEEEERGADPGQSVSKSWGQLTREYPGGPQEDEDLDALLASTKRVKKAKPSTTEEEGPGEGDIKQEASDEVPKKEGDEGDSAAAPENEQAPRVKEEEPTDAAAPGVKSEPEEPASGVVFKKRKPKAMRK